MFCQNLPCNVDRKRSEKALIFLVGFQVQKRRQLKVIITYSQHRLCSESFRPGWFLGGTAVSLRRLKYTNHVLT